MKNFAVTQRIVKAENNLFEANFDEKLQLSVVQQLVVTKPIVPAIQTAEHDFVLVVKPVAVVLIFFKRKINLKI